MRLNKIPQRFISFPKPQTVTLYGYRTVANIINLDEIILN